MTEKIAYIKGLAEGLELDSSKNEVKVINQILELLDQMAAEVEELQDCYDDAVDVVDAINDDLSELEDYVYDIEEDEDDDLIECECPHCGNTIYFDAEAFDLAEDHNCPECGKPLFDEDDGDENKDDE